MGSYDAAAGDIEIDPQCRRFRRSQTNFALQAVVERRAAIAKGITVLLRWHSDATLVQGEHLACPRQTSGNVGDRGRGGGRGESRGSARTRSDIPHTSSRAGNHVSLGARGGESWWRQIETVEIQGTGVPGAWESDFRNLWRTA